MVTLVLVRHGFSEGNKTNTFTGHLDVPLCDIGFKQAELVSDYVLKNFKIDLIYSSPLSRAFNTVKNISEHFNVKTITDDRLKEIYGGKWEGMKFDDISTAYPEEHSNWKNDIGHTRCPEGETMGDVTERVKSFYNEILKENQGKTIVVCAHAGVIRATQCYMQNVDLYGMKDVPWVPNSSISVVDYVDGKFIPDFFGYTDHLGDSITNLPKSI